MTKTGFTGVEKSAKASYKAVKDYADEMKRFGVDTEQKGVKYLYGEGAETAKRKSRILSKAAAGYKPAQLALGKGSESETSQALKNIVGNGMKASQALALLKQQMSGTQATTAGTTSFLDKFASKIVTAHQFVRTFAYFLGGTLKDGFNALKTAVNAVRTALSKLSSMFKSALSAIRSFAS